MRLLQTVRPVMIIDREATLIGLVQITTSLPILLERLTNVRM